MKEVGMQLVKFATETRYEDIPKEIRDYTKGLTLKTVSGMVAGSAKPSGRKMTEVIKKQKIPGEVGVMGSGFKTSLWEAVLLNSYFSHASELEDDRFNGGVCWDIGVIPVLLPLAEKLGLPGKTLLEALVLGLEVHARTCLFGAEHLGLVMVPGAAGPAVGAARAMGLNLNETAAALGLAVSGAQLSIQSFGTDAHYLESALQSLQGIMAADMAKMGLRGNPDVATFLSKFLGKIVEPEKMVADLGKRWIHAEIWVKKYPCCFLLHRQIDLALEMKKLHGFSQEEIETIEVHASPGDIPCNRPEPRDEGDLQFSFQHALSAAMLDGDVNLTHFTPEAVGDPRLKKARSKVKFILYPELSDQFLKAPARLVVKTKDGRSFSGERIYPIGHPTEPLSREQMRELYGKFCRGVLPDQNIAQTAEMIFNLEKVENVRELTRLLI